MPRLRRWRAFAVAVLAAAVLAAPAAHAVPTAIVVDANTGNVLYALNPDDGRYPASLVKMMTLYLTFDALDEGRLSLEQRLPVSASAAARIPSKLYLAPGDAISVEDAILALVTKSANDAASVLAEALGGSERAFAQMMTAKGRAIGMGRTTFQNASGLHHRFQYTTARDMARLAEALLKDYPQYYGYFSTSRFTYRGVTYTNHNNLLGRYAGVDGTKTGYLRTAGYNLAASVVRGGHRLIGVLLGGSSPSSRDETMAQLFDIAFNRIAALEFPGGRESPALGLAAAGGGSPRGLPAPAPPETPAPALGEAPGSGAEWAVQGRCLPRLCRRPSPFEPSVASAAAVLSRRRGRPASDRGRGRPPVPRLHRQPDRDAGTRRLPAPRTPKRAVSRGRTERNAVRLRRRQP